MNNHNFKNKATKLIQFIKSLNKTNVALKRKYEAYKNI